MECFRGFIFLSAMHFSLACFMSYRALIDRVIKEFDRSGVYAMDHFKTSVTPVCVFAKDKPKIVKK